MHFKSILLVSNVKMPLLVLNIQTNNALIHDFIQTEKELQVKLSSLRGITSLFRKKEEKQTCRKIRVNDTVSSLVCHVNYIEPEINYEVLLESPDMGLISINNSIKMQTHQRESLDFEIRPERIMVFGEGIGFDRALFEE